MSPLFDVLMFFHFVFLAALVGGFFVAAYNKGLANPIMLWGARLQLVVGIALYATLISDADGAEINHMVFGMKIVIALAVVALTEVASAAQNRAGLTPDGAARPAATAVRAPLVYIAGALALVNIVLGMVA